MVKFSRGKAGGTDGFFAGLSTKGFWERARGLRVGGIFFFFFFLYNERKEKELLISYRAAGQPIVTRLTVLYRYARHGPTEIFIKENEDFSNII